MKILIVDDDELSLAITEKVLKSTGYQTFLAEDGEQALEILRNEDIQIVISDWDMPVMDGLEATRAIRLQEIKHGLPRTAIIMLTASALPSQIDKAKEAGCDAHLAKPVTASRLFDALAQVMKESAHPEA